MPSASTIILRNCRDRKRLRDMDRKRDEKHMIPLFIATLVLIALIGMYSTWTVSQTFDKAQTTWQAERKDLLDRLMARDLPEVKQAQAIEHRTEGPKSTSKRQNDARLIQMAENAERG